MAKAEPLRLSEITADLSEHSATLDHAIDRDEQGWFCKTCSDRKVALCEYLLRINEQDKKHPFIPPTAIDWLGNGMVAALVTMDREARG